MHCLHHHGHMDCGHVIVGSSPKSVTAESGIFLFSESLRSLGPLVWMKTGAHGAALLCGQVKQAGSANRPVFSELIALPCLYFLLKEDIVKSLFHRINFSGPFRMGSELKVVQFVLTITSAY